MAKVLIGNIKGPPGDPGNDGTSVTHEWNGSTLTITSASGTSSADLKGPQGDPGNDGATPVRGEDYWTEEDKQEITGSIDISGKLDKSGGAMTGTLTASYSDDGGQVRNIYIVSSEPDSSVGNDGDIALVVGG